MNIAFTAKGKEWDSNIDPRFGRAEYILIYNDINLDSFNNDKTLLYQKIIYDETELDIDFTLEMQKLLTGESKNNGYILEASRESNNFSHLTFYNESDTASYPKLEIMLVE